jgi:rare lipoprotein A
MRYAIRHIVAVAALATLSSCGSFDGAQDIGATQTASSNAANEQGAVSDFPVKLGVPYNIGNKTYTPEDVANYDDVGYASYYGEELSGRPTANGEVFIPSAVTAAHKTLPMPSYVEVTALDTGRTILVRVNDRGPFSNERLIDLSEGAARQLGITSQGVSGVRVRKVNPPEQERAVLRQGRPAAERIDTPESLLRVLRDKLSKLPKPQGASTYAKPTPTPTTSTRTAPASPPATGNGRFIREGSGTSVKAAPSILSNTPVTASTDGKPYVVQVAAFSTRARADALARKLGAKVSVSADGKLFRVRYGPYANEADAEGALATAKQRGYPQARLLKE